MSGIECPKCGTWKMHVGATTAERECENGHRFTVQGDRNPIPTEEYTADFLAHAAINTSQYDRTCRVLAAEVIRNRAKIDEERRTGNAEATELSQARIEIARLRAVLTKMASADEWSGGVWFRGTAHAALRSP